MIATTTPLKGDVNRSFQWPWYEENTRWLHEWAKGRSRSLEFGCGVGWMTSRLAQAGMDALGIDLDEAKIAKAVETYPEGEFLVLEMNPDSFEDGSFDFVVSNQVLEHVPDVDAVLSMLYKATSEGARVFFSVPNGSGLCCLLYDKIAVKLGRKGEHKQFKPLKEWTRVFEENGFHVVRVRTQNMLPYRLFPPGFQRRAAGFIHGLNYLLCALTPTFWASSFFYCLERIDTRHE